eukprot:TRINITY_DN1462_c0_g1_i1.p1 TRINITY_DN1462_c0_g1~~TRINITY_DN1462_c0_g1_i1.p1  ORF type:complete len:877 (+),score=164.73 TRINITY_DN1462_c0_g1_i1:241-2631(+)
MENSKNDSLEYALVALGSAGRLSKKQDIRNRVAKILIGYINNESGFDNERYQKVLYAASEGLARLNPDISYLIKHMNGDINLLFDVLLVAGDEPLYNNQFKKGIKIGAELLLKNRELLPIALKKLRDYLQKSIEYMKNNEFYFRLDIIVDIMAEVVQKIPSTFMTLADPEIFSPLLTMASYYLPSFPGRIACFTLLCSLKELPSNLFSTLRSCLYDVGHVRQCALQIISFLKFIPKHLLPELIEGLYDDSSLLSYSYGLILCNIAKDSRTSHKNTMRILSALQKASKSHKSERGVYLLKNECNGEIEYLNQLNALFSHMVLDILHYYTPEIKAENFERKEKSISIVHPWIKKCRIPCLYNDGRTEFDIYFGNPYNEPVLHQQIYLEYFFNSIILNEVLDTLTRLKALADTNGIWFSQICSFALQSHSGRHSKDLLVWPYLPNEVNDTTVDAQTFYEEKEGVQSLLHLAMDSIRENKDYNFDFTNLTYSLRRWVEEIGPNQLLYLKEILPKLCNAYNQGTAFFGDFLMSMPVPYKCLDLDIGVSINFERVDVKYNTKIELYSMELYDNLSRMWSEVGGDDEDILDLYYTQKESNVNNIGFNLCLGSDEIVSGWYLAQEKMSLISLLSPMDKSSIAKMILEWSGDSGYLTHCNYFGKDITLEEKPTIVRFDINTSFKLEEVITRFDNLARLLHLIPIPSKILDVFDIYSLPEETPAQITLRFDEEKCSLCGLIIPIDESNHSLVIDLLKIDGNYKKYQNYLEYFSKEDMEYIELQTVLSTNGRSGLNYSYDVLLHCKY